MEPSSTALPAMPAVLPPPAPPLCVLTLGDGNLSFSLALLRLYRPSRRERARQLSPAAPRSLHPPPPLDRPLRLVCSVYDSEAELAAKYPETAQGLLDKLRQRGAEVLFGVDATDILPSIAAERARQAAQSGEAGGEEAVDCFDVVVFHHPHSGREDALYHRRLLSHFFHSALSATHGSSALVVSLCDRQPWQWQLADRAARHGWSCADLGGWQAEMGEWAALGYETKRHHTGRQFNAHHVTHRHKATLTRRDGDHHALDALRRSLALLLAPTQQYTDDQLAHLAGLGAEAEAEAEAAQCDDAALAAALCPVCQQPHSSQSSRVQPLSPSSGQARCDRCHLAFPNQRALQQHAAAMQGRDDHIAMQQGQGKRQRHRMLREEGVVTAEMRQRGERIRAKKLARRQ